MWKGKGRSGFGESSTLGDYDDWSCLSRNGNINNLLSGVFFVMEF